MFCAAGTACFAGAAGFACAAGFAGTAGFAAFAAGFLVCAAGFAAFFERLLAGFFMPRNLHERSSDRQRGVVLREAFPVRERPRASAASGSPVSLVRIQSVRRFAPRLS